MGNFIIYNDGKTLRFLTSRCFQERFLLRPDEKTNEIVGSVLARTQHLYPQVEVYGFIAMSNHVHGLVRGSALDVCLFKMYFFREVAKRMNALRGRHGKFWHRRCTDTPVVQAAAEWERLDYLYMNPVKARLTPDPRAWIGFSTLHESLGGKPRTYTFFDRTGYNRARQSRKEVNKADFIHHHTLNIKPFRAYQGNHEGFSDKLEKMLERSIDHYRQERKRTGQRLVPSRDVFRVDPFSRPENPKKGNRVVCHAASKEAREAYKEEYRQFCDAYRIASKAYREGDLTVSFPEHAFRPPVPAGIETSEVMPRLAASAGVPA